MIGGGCRLALVGAALVAAFAGPAFGQYEHSSSRIVGPATSDATVALLPNDTAISLMVLTEVTSQRARVGDEIKLRLAEPVLRDQAILLPVGTLATGVVTEATNSGAALKPGTVGLELTHMTSACGRIKLKGSYHRVGRGGKNDDLVKAVLVPMYVLFSPGNSGKLKAGELIVAKVDGDHQLGNCIASH